MNGEKIPSGYLSAERTRNILGVTNHTLRAWEKEGKIEIYRAPGKYTHRKYNVKKFIQSQECKEEYKEQSGEENIQRKRIIYSRVSTKNQSENLKRQSDILREKYPTHELIEDIGSGMDFKRKGLKTILDLAFKDQLEEIVVTHKDRLCRFGFDLFEYLFTELSNAKIVVLDKRETSPNEELVEDILSVVTVFSAKINGRKRYTRGEPTQGGPTNGGSVKNVKVQDLSDIETEDDNFTVGGD
jgi:putative resolvase